MVYQKSAKRLILALKREKKLEIKNVLILISIDQL